MMCSQGKGRPEINMIEKIYAPQGILQQYLFIIARTWKQPKCSMTEEWIKKMWYIYPVEYYSAVKRNEIVPFAETWMDLEIVVLSEVSHFSVGEDS